MSLKIFLANSSKQSVGGGWSWISNFKKALPENVTEDYNEAGVFLIPSPSMIGRDEFQHAKQDGKKIVLRVDNIVRNSRNRNTGMSRMKDFAEGADLVIFQSEFARELLLPFLKVSGPVILNGCDTQIFNSEGRSYSGGRFLYSRVNRDETKNWEMARYYFSKIHLQNRDTHLSIIGNFSPELIQGNFDFYMDEKYAYFGVVGSMESLAGIYSTTDKLLYSYWQDACSNTLIEAVCCGMDIVDVEGMAHTGGAPEIMQHRNNPEYFSLKRMGAEYLEAISELV